MTNQERSAAETPNPNRDVKPEAVDLGDDVQRTPANQGSGLDREPNTGLEGGIDPRMTDLGDDVQRTPTNQGSELGGDPNTGLEGGVDPRMTDLGDDVYRTA